MYEHFFGFSQRPFNVTPDPRFLFMTDSHQEALASLVYGIQERRGFISISGEIGTGKTTLLNYLQTILDPNVKTVFIFQTQITFEELLEQILRDLKLRIIDRSKISMTRELKRYLFRAFERKENMAILIDEAQNLSNEVLEELRMLSNIETGEAKLFQMILIGQPELEKKLNSEGLRQLKQRIGIRRQIRPLSQEESRLYIEQRLQKIGSSIEEVFTPEALELICLHSKGIFRTINILCDNAFLIGYSLKTKRIHGSIVREVLGDMGIEVPKDSFQTKRAYSPESAIHAHYQGPSKENGPEYGKESQSQHGRWWTIPGILGALALALVFLVLYLGWVYLYSGAELSKSRGNFHLPVDEDRSKNLSSKNTESVRNSHAPPVVEENKKMVLRHRQVHETESDRRERMATGVPTISDIRFQSGFQGREPKETKPEPMEDRGGRFNRIMEKGFTTGQE
jgi:type II secretory pathway predicted ATPase ExeA